MNEQLIWETERGTFLVVMVRPNSKDKGLVHSYTNTEIVINLSNPAREGKANTELIRRISKGFDIAASDVMIVAGHKSKKKTLLLRNITADEVRKHIAKS